MPTFNIFIQSGLNYKKKWCQIINFLCIIVITFLDYYQLIPLINACFTCGEQRWRVENVNMLLQIETNFITYVTCVHVAGPAHLGIIRIYIVSIDPAHADNDYEVSLETNDHHLYICALYVHWLCWGLTTRQPLWVILCRLPEKKRKEIEEIKEDEREG